MKTVTCRKCEGEDFKYANKVFMTVLSYNDFECVKCGEQVRLMVEPLNKKVFKLMENERGKIEEHEYDKHKKKHL